VDLWGPADISTPDPGSLDILANSRAAAGVVLTRVPYAIRNALFYLFLLFLCRVLFRNQWLAAGAFSVGFAVLGYLGGGGHPAIGALVSFIYFAVIAIVLLHWGLVSVAIAIFITDLIMNVSPILDASVWFFGSELALFTIPVALAAWALYTAVGGRGFLKANAAI
jgi:hypothetical protein